MAMPPSALRGSQWAELGRLVNAQYHRFVPFTFNTVIHR